MRKILLTVGVMAILLAFVGMSGTASAASGSDTIPAGQYVYHPIQFTSYDYMDVDYTMTVTSGPDVNVYFVDSDNFGLLEDGADFDYYLAMSEQDTSYASGSITLTEHDTYYLIFDNSDNSGIAQVNYDATTFAYDSPLDTVEDAVDIMIWIGIIAVIVVIVIVAIIAYALFHKKSPPPQQYQQPPQYAPQQQAPPQQRMCVQCGRPIPAEAVFCPYCGGR